MWLRVADVIAFTVVAIAFEIESAGKAAANFYEESLDLQVMADPAEQQVLVLPMGPGVPLDLERAATVIERLQLQAHVVPDRERWQQLDAAVAIPRLEAVA